MRERTLKKEKSPDQASKKRARRAEKTSRPTQTRFVIFGSPRTGSSHLTALLNSHKDILLNGAIFHHNKVWVHWKNDGLTPEIANELLRLRKNDPDAFLERVLQTNSGHAAVGFKMFSHHDRGMLHKIASDTSIKKIVLHRKNVLANYSSRLIARETGKYSVKVGENRPKRPLVPFDPDHFIKFHNTYIRFYRDIAEGLAETRQTFHLICYDEINDMRLLANLINFLGLDPADAALNSRADKQNPSDMRSRFSNPEDLERFCRERGLEHWLQEGEASLSALSKAPPPAG